MTSRTTLISPAAACTLTAAFFALCLCGCSQDRSVIDAFPVGSQASPWKLDGTAWAGPFEAARDSIGKEADQWDRFGPRGAWLARYSHESRPGQTITIRGLSFDSDEKARAAYDSFAEPDAKEFRGGDRGCWTKDGVLFQWNRLVFDVFSRNGDSPGDPLQCVYLTAFIEKRMPAGMPESPR